MKKLSFRIFRSIPQVLIRIKKVDRQKFSKNEMQSVRNFINESLLPAMHKTDLQVYEKSKNHLSIEEFLEDFGISKKGVSHRGTWRWLHEFGYKLRNRRKVISWTDTKMKKT